MKDSDKTIWKCPMPKCGGDLVRRTNKSSGSEFLGCSHYPRCKYTQKCEDEQKIEDAASRWE